MGVELHLVTSKDQLLTLHPFPEQGFLIQILSHCTVLLEEVACCLWVKNLF